MPGQRPLALDHLTDWSQKIMVTALCALHSSLCAAALVWVCDTQLLVEFSAYSSVTSSASAMK
jgi:hypothetical protein